VLAIIGGTGFYQLEGLSVEATIPVETPFGEPSAPIVKGIYQDKPLLFLPRHGEKHSLLPHEINYRANIFALKSLGAKQVISISATGSLREDIHPGQLVIPSQYIDFTRGTRASTFFGQGIVAHISTGEPVCRPLIQWIDRTAKEEGIDTVIDKTYACVNGPRLGTKAESHFLRLVGCDLVGMTNVPEVFLAKEAQLCYATIAIVTDYDCWMDDPEHQVSVSAVISRYGECVKTIQHLLQALFSRPLPSSVSEAACRMSLREAVLTPEKDIPSDKRAWFDVLNS